MQMITLTTGPELRKRIEVRCPRVPDFGGVHANYTYIDKDGHRQPEYAATHIRANVHYSIFRVSLLDGIEETLKSIPGFRSAERIERHPILRPQVIAVFERETI
jgi:hypothetical protein